MAKLKSVSPISDEDMTALPGQGVGTSDQILRVGDGLHVNQSECHDRLPVQNPFTNFRARALFRKSLRAK